MQSLIIVVRVFIDICFWRKGPQDLPESREFLWLCVLAYLVSSIVLLVSTEPLSLALVTSVLGAVFLALYSYLVLKLFNVPDRWTQTCTALLGTAAVLGFIGIPLFYASPGPETQTAQNLEWYLLLLTLLLWNVLVYAHIFRNALSATSAVGLMIAILYTVLSMMLSSVLSPGQVAQ